MDERGIVLGPLLAAYGHRTTDGVVRFAASTVRNVTDVLLATDADWLFDEIDAALGGDFMVSQVREGAQVAVACEQVEPALVILDLQIGNMGGMAVSMLLTQEIRAGRLEPTRILMLLDREHDTWLAGQAESDGWLVKPLDSFRIRNAARALLEGGTVQEGPVATG